MKKKPIQKKTMRKKTKIILASVLSVIILAGVATGIYFGLEHKRAETVFAETGTVAIFDDNTIKFTFITPYIENGEFEVINENGVIVTTEGKKIGSEIVSVEYRPATTDTLEGGTVVVTADLEEKLVDGTSYRATITAETLKLAKKDYTNKDITADFKAKKDDNGQLNAQEEKYKDATSVVLSDVKPVLYKKGAKAYFEVTAKADGVTTYNKAGSQNFQAFCSYRYKNSEGTFVRFMTENVQCTIKNGVIKIVAETPAENLIPGQDYTLLISKGFFINEDQTIVNEEYEALFTYVEQ